MVTVYNVGQILAGQGLTNMLVIGLPIDYGAKKVGQILVSQDLCSLG